jgi:hypothetical protein
MGSGLIPPEVDEGHGQWEITKTGLEKVRDSSGNPGWQWRIAARFKPEMSLKALNPLDIIASVDGTKIPFTFHEDSQLFECVTVSKLAPGSHEFELAPSSSPSRDFPALTVRFEVPPEAE